MLRISASSAQRLLIQPPPFLQKRLCSLVRDSLLNKALEGFKDLKDKDKLEKLKESAIEVYQASGVEIQDTVEKTEMVYQRFLVEQPKPLPIYPSEISKDKTTVYWHNYHKVGAPFKQATTNLKHEDKEVALDMLFQLQSEGRIKIDQEVVLLIINGCDNNEAGIKMRLRLEEKGVKTQVVATDVSLDALSKSRGLDHFINKRLPNIPESTIVLHDFFLEGSDTNIDSEHQKIALPFRLTAIAPQDKVKEAVKKVISSSDICILHFLEDKELTQKTLERRRFQAHRKTLEIEGLEIPYYESKKGNTICVWNREKVSKVIELSGGAVLEIKAVETHDDEDNSINMIVVVVENQKSKEKNHD